MKPDIVLFDFLPTFLDRAVRTGEEGNDKTLVLSDVEKTFPELYRELGKHGLDPRQIVLHFDGAKNRWIADDRRLELSPFHQLDIHSNAYADVIAALAEKIAHEVSESHAADSAPVGGKLQEEEK